MHPTSLGPVSFGPVDIVESEPQPLTALEIADLIETLIETCHEMDLCGADELQQLGTIADELRAMMDADEGDLEDSFRKHATLCPIVADDTTHVCTDAGSPATSIKMIQRAIISTNSHHEAELWLQTFSPLLPN